MHQLEILDPNIDINSLEYFMADHSDFILTSNSFRCDLGRCIMYTKEPYPIFKLLSFRLQKEETVQAFENWQAQRIQASRNKQEADKLGITVKEYMETVRHMTYDKEFDEPRLIAKVPGVNCFLEFYGLFFEMPDMKEYKSDKPGIDNAIFLNDIKRIMQETACWFRGSEDKYQLRKMGTDINDSQLLNSWKENYINDEFFKKAPYRGIGFDEIDTDRRMIRPRHKFNDEEKAEYDMLKNKYGDSLSLDQISAMAARNVKHRHADK